MLKFYDENGNSNPLVGYDDLHIKHKINGNDEMSFILPVDSSIYKLIGEETQIDYGENEWLVKKIDDDKFDCRLNFDFLKTRAYVDFKEQTKPLAYILEKYLPNGWTVFGANVSSISRTIEFDVCTDYDIINECMKTYSVYFVWEIKNRKLYVYSQDLNTDGIGGYSSDFAVRLYAYGADGLTLENANVNGATYGKKYIDSTEGASRIIEISWTDTSYTNASTLYSAAESRLNTLVTQLIASQGAGEYITKDLNLRSLSYKGESTDFATRLYAYGADGLTLEDATVGGSRYGLKYVDNNQYADKVVCVVWKDERYTVVNELYKAAQKKLAELAVPTRSYECSVTDLAKQNNSFDFLKFKMHYKAILLDPDRKTRIVHKVVEYDEYPDEPSRNVVTLSCTAGTIQSYVNSVSTGFKEEVEKVNTTFEGKVLMATALLLSAFGTYTFEDEEGNTYFADNEDLNAAESVWIINKNGIGHSSTGRYGPYTSSWTSNDELVMSIINSMVIRGEYIEAGSIKAGQIDVDYTDGVLSSAYHIAEGVVENRVEKVEKYLHNEEETGELDVLKNTLAEYREEINGWSATFTDRYKGGINSILNSSGLNGTTHWIAYNDSGIGAFPSTFQGGEAEGNTVSNSAFVLNKNNNIRQEIEGLVKGSVYTLSGMLKVLGTGSFTVELAHYDKDGNYVLDKEMLRTPVTPDTYDWQEFVIQLPEMTRSPIVLKFKNANSNSAMYLSDLMLVEGEVKKSWTPAPNEIYTTQTKIDKNGVTVENKQSLQKTMMTPTEFAGYYNDEKIFSINGDETHAKNTLVDGKLVIAKVSGYDRKGIIAIPYDDGTSKGANIAVLD